jgi:hypothetical protein
MTITESAPASQRATITPLEKLLVDVCTNTKSLESVSQDPAAAFRAAGASDFAVNCLSMQRGSWISLALSTSQPIPTQEAIDSFLAKRVREDAFFADRLRTEPRRILERSFSTRFPGSATFEVIELDGYPTVLVKGVVPGAINTNDLSPHADTEVDTDTDTDIDVDTDVVTDVIADVDIDTDIDIDVDTVVDTDNSLVGVTETPDSRLRTLHDKKWSEFWGRHEAMWASRDDRRVS